MYSVTLHAKRAWAELLAWVERRAGVDWPMLEHEPPLLLSDLWARNDLGCAMMCGLPYSLRVPRPQLIAAPVPSLPRYDNRAVYCTDIAVKADSPDRTIEDTYGKIAGYTLKDSQSGYFAFRYYLLQRQSAVATPPYRQIVGNLINARGVINAIAAGKIDVGPLDGYVHDLLQHSDPAFAKQVRVVASTDPTAMPPLVATANIDDGTLARLRDAFLAVEHAAELAQQREALLLRRFVVPSPGDYDLTKARAQKVESSEEVW
jgi:ABC-type phosphate/phosphonate transport system substrate-binding protein